MKEHLMQVHKALAAHHGRVAAVHEASGDALEENDPHAQFHRSMAAEHADLARFHGKCAKAMDESDDELPDVDAFDPSGRSKALIPADPRARMSRAAYDDGLDKVRGALPDDEGHKKRLEDRGLRTVGRAGQPTFDEVFGGDGLETAAAQLDPELRKAIV